MSDSYNDMIIGEIYNKHYIKLDDRNRIIDTWSDGPNYDHDLTDAICINEQGSYQFRFENGGEENPNIWNFEGIPLYKYLKGNIVPRTEEEIQADIDALPEPEPTPMEQLRADIDFIAAMSDVSLS